MSSSALNIVDGRNGNQTRDSLMPVRRNVSTAVRRTSTEDRSFFPTYRCRASTTTRGGHGRAESATVGGILANKVAVKRAALRRERRDPGYAVFPVMEDGGNWEVTIREKFARYNVEITRGVYARVTVEIKVARPCARLR